ncbi:protein of unknown function [Cribrihabitans marinus]|uniref:YjiS-like domain-containing protein n=1 Tax=Cribrihabitans marinus TaxID=1227549 RepID=A0A1H7DVC2_9RHOB|nr:DUF1127 domain-containing protein [Cribrihabitans marinus]GGH40760.1 hypothetical protein GCM10010973_37310 [Cribrihabitans marinus]SEK05691.1 protein of unknown function [Cribrihabitans marinus]
MAYANITEHLGHGLTARIRTALDAYKAARTQRAEYRRTVDELSNLSDRELTDLGLGRYDIPEVARRHVYGH